MTEERKDDAISASKEARVPKKKNDIEMMMDEEAGDNENSTYNKFKTQNELDLEKAF